MQAIGDVNNDDAIDIIVQTRNPEQKQYLIFGTQQGRREVISIDELDGALGVNMPGEIAVKIADVNDDGFADLLFPGDQVFIGRGRDVSSINGPVVRRSPEQFFISLGEFEASGNDRVDVSINGVVAGSATLAAGGVVIDDSTGGSEALIELSAGSHGNAVLATRMVPAFEALEELQLTQLAPRLIELTFIGDSWLRRYSNYLVWRNGVPIGRSINRADNYIDNTLELGQSYTYFVTPDYLVGESLDSGVLEDSPLLQRQSNSVTVITQ